MNSTKSMKSKKQMPFVAEVVCSFKTVRTAPLSPFVWVLLKTLKVFAVGERPSWEELAIKLAIGEASFLSEGWAEAFSDNLVDDVSFVVAKITEEGGQALQDGFIRTSGPRCRKNEVLYFRLDDGEPINWKHNFEVKSHSKLARPKWADKLNAGYILSALEKQRFSPDDLINEDEKIFDLEFDWDKSSQVKLD